MKLYKVVGNVTLARSHPTYAGAKLLAVESVGEELAGRKSPAEPDLLIVWDDRGAGMGSILAVSDGGEASQAFRPELKAVDAYASAILDTVIIDKKIAKQIK
jgi:ethanolamine utilization protein EutN